jgi:hypothetical protein
MLNVLAVDSVRASVLATLAESDADVLRQLGEKQPYTRPSVLIQISSTGMREMLLATFLF